MEVQTTQILSEIMFRKWIFNCKNYLLSFLLLGRFSWVDNVSNLGDWGTVLLWDGLFFGVFLQIDLVKLQHKNNTFYFWSCLFSEHCWIFHSYMLVLLRLLFEVSLINRTPSIAVFDGDNLEVFMIWESCTLEKLVEMRLLGFSGAVFGQIKWSSREVLPS